MEGSSAGLDPRQELSRHRPLLLVYHYLHASYCQRLTLPCPIPGKCNEPQPILELLFLKVLVTFLISVVMAIFAGVKAMIVAGCGQVYVLEAG